MRSKKIYTLLTLIFTLTIVTFSLSVTHAANEKLNVDKKTMHVGETYALKVKGTTSNVKWSSDNESVATISAKGKVTALKKGTATITAIVDSKKLTCKLTVKKQKGLSALETYLLEKSILNGKRTEMLAGIIGAEKGFKYSEGNIEVYEYDVKSNAYKEVKKSNRVTLEGFDMEFDISAINGKFILICESSSNKERAVKVFKAFK